MRMNCHLATRCSFVSPAFSPLKRKVSVCVLFEEEKALVMKSITFLKNFSLWSVGHFFQVFFCAITAPPAAKAAADAPNRPPLDAATEKKVLLTVGVDRGGQGEPRPLEFSEQ